MLRFFLLLLGYAYVDILWSACLVCVGHNHESCNKKTDPIEVAICLLN